ncbi:unnamed protein product [Calicophoron daubneyi]|uniref:Very-long-chain (3R)-3-hydroxyacyl-CoA dehydratase n=1 Tax=Calicophoron daubneyi TaxID=300641 RepID=A0AAV2T874_CALDB
MLWDVAQIRIQRSFQQFLPSSKMSLKKAYLFGYNVIQLLGWSYLLFIYITESEASGAWLTISPKVEFLLQVFQTLAFLEVIHAVTRLVRSSPFTTALQLFSRVFLVWGILYLIPQVKLQSYGIPLIMIPWCLSEMIRYAYYATNVYCPAPTLITWLRYSGFVVLYPCGVTGELLLMYGAVQEKDQCDRYSLKLPNTLNCSFDYRCMIVLLMLSYVPFFPKLFGHMVSQRKKVFKVKAQ